MSRFDNLTKSLHLWYTAKYGQDMRCDVCNNEYAKRMTDGVFRCLECRKIAENRPGWKRYVKEVQALDKCDYWYRRKGKFKYYKGRKI